VKPIPTSAANARNLNARIHSPRNCQAIPRPTVDKVHVHTSISIWQVRKVACCVATFLRPRPAGTCRSRRIKCSLCSATSRQTQHSTTACTRLFLMTRSTSGHRSYRSADRRALKFLESGTGARIRGCRPKAAAGSSLPGATPSPGM